MAETFPDLHQPSSSQWWGLLWGNVSAENNLHLPLSWWDICRFPFPFRSTSTSKLVWGHQYHFPFQSLLLPGSQPLFKVLLWSSFYQQEHGWTTSVQDLWGYIDFLLHRRHWTFTLNKPNAWKYHNPGSVWWGLSHPLLSLGFSTLVACMDLYNSTDVVCCTKRAGTQNLTCYSEKPAVFTTQPAEISHCHISLQFPYGLCLLSFMEKSYLPNMAFVSPFVHLWLAVSHFIQWEIDGLEDDFLCGKHILPLRKPLVLSLAWNIRYTDTHSWYEGALWLHSLGVSFWTQVQYHLLSAYYVPSTVQDAYWIATLYSVLWVLSFPSQQKW